MELIERYTVSKDWMTLALLLVFLLVVVAKLVYPERFGNFTKLFYTKRYFRTNQKVMALTDSFSVIFCAVHVLSVSLLIYIVLDRFSLKYPVQHEVLFIQIMLAYSLFYMVKYFLEKITADIFKINQVINSYIFYKITYRNFIALFIIPIDILLIYAFRPSQIFLVIILVLTASINTTILVFFYRKKRTLLLDHWFYFILYLCAFEIAPYFILYKVVTTA